MLSVCVVCVCDLKPSKRWIANLLDFDTKYIRDSKPNTETAGLCPGVFPALRSITLCIDRI